jgi:hypothetical protein
MLAVPVTDAQSVARAFGIVDAVHSGMARAGVADGEVMTPGDDYYLSPYATVAVPQLSQKRRRGQSAAEETFLVFRSYKVRQAHADSVDLLALAAQELVVLSASTEYMFIGEDEEGFEYNPFGRQVPRAALRELVDPSSTESANFERGFISTELEDLAYRLSCEHIGAAPDAAWREARRAEGQAAAKGQELLLAELPESVPN